MDSILRQCAIFVMLACSALAAIARGQTITVTVDTSPAGREQIIDGFGTGVFGVEGQQTWFQRLLLDDLRASILRFDITPQFKAPYSELHYYSPWFDQVTPLTLPGPDQNNVRTYTGPSDYSRSYGGHRAPIAVMGPDIDENAKVFDFDAPAAKTAGTIGRAAKTRRASLGDFKLVGSVFSPAPWLKVSSGNSIAGQTDPLPKNGTKWPFIWGGNFSGGYLDVSGKSRPEFDDSGVGGRGPTSALIQFARGLAAYLRGFQNTYGIALYAISLQNEPGFEEFYNSCAYPQSSEFTKVLKAARVELDKYPDLAGIRIMGPEDVLGTDAYGMWMVGSSSHPTDKNLRYLENIGRDREAARLLSFFAIHGYAEDGATAVGVASKQWSWWREGWHKNPAFGLPSDVKGFVSYGKRSWMTETSGEEASWLAPPSGFPAQGAWSIALKIQQALTTGQESAWIYLQLSDGNARPTETLTNYTLGSQSPKYVAAKHFFRFIRPGAVRVNSKVTGSTRLSVSAYVNDAEHTLVLELLNLSARDALVNVVVPTLPLGLSRFEVVTSSNHHLWQTSTINVLSQRAAALVPAYGIVTLLGRGSAIRPSTSDR